MIIPIAILDPGAGPIYVIDFVYITNVSPNEVSVQWSIPTDGPGSYKVQYSTDYFATTLGTYVTTSNTKNITGLTPGTTYQVKVTGYSGTSGTGLFGGSSMQVFTTILPANPGGVVATPGGSGTPSNTPPTGVDLVAILNKLYSCGTACLTPYEMFLIGIGPNPAGGGTGGGTGTGSSPLGSSIGVKGNATVQYSLFSVTNKNTVPGKCSLVYKDLAFDATQNYYMFGTTIFFNSSTDGTQAAGGIGFFTGLGGDNGYYIELQTTNNLANKDDKEVKIWKHYGSQRIRLSDSQKGVAKSFNGLYGGTSYKVDVKVKRSATKVVIDVYINNLRITASDNTVSGTTDPAQTVLPTTSGMAMFSTVGTTNFDYIYAIPILTEKEYNDAMSYNIYTGKFASTSLNFLYGDKVLDNLGKTTGSNGVVEEFGTVARELRKVNIKYPSRPGYPLYPSIGTNNFIQVLGSKMSNFGAEIYLLNNAGTYIPLDDSVQSSFSIIGNYISSAGEYEYTDTTSNEYDNPEPATFDSTWIQSEPDAKNISNWIKKQWSKQQNVVTMNVFGNPLISVGDIITINYPANDLDGTQKFIVTNVNNSYNEGLDTSITCRSIYS